MSQKNPFPYPGGKALTAPRIIDKIPDHECYVEVFGGAASVLCQKDPSMSMVEIYNDLNDDVVNYFEIARERPEELREYLDGLPYSRLVHAEVMERWFGQGKRPEDDLIRAAEFVYLRTASHNSLFGKSGFAAGRKRNHARRFRKVTDRIEWVSDRFQGVVIENDDWERIVDRYDGTETVFYFDPPYTHIDDSRLYAGDPTGFDHDSFVDRLTEIEGKWIASYSDVPEKLGRYATATEQWSKSWKAGAQEGEDVRGKESLVMNYDPASEQLASVQTSDPSEW